jgi:chromosome segregation ATPase
MRCSIWLFQNEPSLQKAQDILLGAQQQVSAAQELVHEWEDRVQQLNQILGQSKKAIRAAKHQQHLLKQELADVARDPIDQQRGVELKRSIAATLDDLQSDHDEAAASLAEAEASLAKAEAHLAEAKASLAKAAADLAKAKASSMIPCSSLCDTSAF